MTIWIDSDLSKILVESALKVSDVDTYTFCDWQTHTIAQTVGVVGAE